MVVYIIGTDYRITEDSIVGASFAHVNGVIKLKNQTVPEDMKIDNNTISIYSQTDVTNKLYLQGIFSASNSNTKIRRVFNIAGGNHEGKGKLKNTSYNFSTLAGYKAKLSNNGLYFIPTIGLDYGSHKDSKFHEKGLGIYNRNIKANSYNSLTGNIGAKLAIQKQISQGLALAPEIHGSISQDLNIKPRKIQTKLSINDSYSEVKINNKDKTTYNFGAGMVTKINNKVDISATYDLTARKKYQAHQGSLQLKIYF
ncbi:MAG: autotransporter outer membrane beta-barrel domain-containing protein [Rickettsiaceae bacterium]|nr:autotransporter outer membrane beta-barrel domain-containing protein [Rickettsiaceae bacterium]